MGGNYNLGIGVRILLCPDLPNFWNPSFTPPKPFYQLYSSAWTRNFNTLQTPRASVLVFSKLRLANTTLVKPAMKVCYKKILEEIIETVLEYAYKSTPIIYRLTCKVRKKTWTYYFRPYLLGSQRIVFVFVFFFSSFFFERCLCLKLLVCRVLLRQDRADDAYFAFK